MIKRDTVAHIVLTTIADNPMAISDISRDTNIEDAQVSVAIRTLVAKGVKILKDGKRYSIKNDDLPKFGMYAHEKVYMFILNNGRITGSDFKRLFTKNYNTNVMRKVIARMERDFGVKTKTYLIRPNGWRKIRAWEIVG
jgi:biotin operon repressor